MKIAILVPQFPHIVQTYTLNLISSLVKLGNEVTVITRKEGDTTTLPPSYYDNNLKSKTIYLNPEKFHFILHLISTNLFNIKYLRNLIQLLSSKDIYKFGLLYVIKSIIFLRVINKTNFDIMHSHSFFTSYDYLFLSKIFNIPLVATFHGLTPKGVNPLAQSKLRLVFEITSLFFVNTQFAKQQLVEMGCPADKIAIVPQGTKTSEFNYNECLIEGDKIFSILTVGRLSAEKGHIVALKAIKRLVQDYPFLHYHIVGSGPEYDALYGFTIENNLDEFVTFHNTVSDKELKKIFSSSSIFILPSIDPKDGFHVETQGVVLQEAQSSGTLVIASRTGGIPEIIKNEETGLLFEEGNSDDLYAVLHKLINDVALQNKIIRSAFQDVCSNYETSVITNTMQKHYLRIVDSHRKIQN